MGKVYKFLTSIKFALILFLFIGLFSALATLVPQGREADYYLRNYHQMVGKIILAIDFHKFFRSALFLIPSAAFFLNLSLCMIKRLYRRAKSGAPGRYGPDIIHIGIMLIIIGGTINLFERQEGFIWLDPGQEIVITGEWSLRLNSFEFQLYDDGRPKDWLSHVTVLKGGEEFRNATIEVNKPLSIKNLKLFQHSYSMKDTVTLTDKSGENIILKSNEGLRLPDSILVFSNVDRRGGGVGIFRELHEEDKHTIMAEIGDVVSGFKVTDFTKNEVTGLSIVKEPGYILIFVSLIILTFGMALTYIQKIGEKK
jgi:cytochrome c biogenesis protein